MGNVSSFPNQTDELTALSWHHREYWDASINMFTETSLNTLTPDMIATLDGFNLIQVDRGVESGKRKGGGQAGFVNDKWCSSGHNTIKEKLCCKDTELLVVSMRSYYLMRKFSHIIALAVYVPPCAHQDCTVFL